MVPSPISEPPGRESNSRLETPATSMPSFCACQRPPYWKAPLAKLVRLDRPPENMVCHVVTDCVPSAQVTSRGGSRRVILDGLYAPIASMVALFPN